MKTFATLMLETSEIYSKEMSDIFVKTFYDDICAYKTEDVVSAFRKHRTVSEFFPTPAAIIKLMPKLKDSDVVKIGNDHFYIREDGSKRKIFNYHE